MQRLDKWLGTILLLLSSFIWSGSASAEDYPTRPINLIMLTSAGGTVDPVNRIIADKVSSIIGQPIVLDYRPGAGGTIGASALWRATPDGYTMGVIPASLVAQQALGKKAPYEIQKFVVLGAFYETLAGLMVKKELGVKTVAELVALAKSKPGVLNFGSSGIGGAPHLALELFNQAYGTNMTHIPFTGDTPAYTALIAGQIDVYLTGVAPAIEAQKSGRAEVLAVTGDKRWPSAPDVPTFKEAGVPVSAEFRSYNGWAMPPGTPAANAQKISDALMKASQDPEVRERILKTGISVVSIPPAEYLKIIAADTEKYQALSKATGVHLD